VNAAPAVQFRVKNFGFAVTGNFTGVAGKIVFDPLKYGEAVFDVSVDATTVNTDNSMRDDHLRRVDYLDVERYPKIRLVSEHITAGSSKGMYVFSGRLEMKGRAKVISFPFSAEALVGGGYRFKGGFTIKRKEFGIGGTSTISDELDVLLDVIAK
jgi:polyisoprenoid-binding protein YceI